MKILLLGANGMLGPHVVKVLEKEHDLILSDVHACCLLYTSDADDDS